MTVHTLWDKAVSNRDWRAPIAAGAYVIVAVACSVIVTFVLGYFLYLRPIERSQNLAKTALVKRQQDTNTIAHALCVSRVRSLQTYRDKHSSMKTRRDSKSAADAYWKIISGLNPKPPTDCHGRDPYP